VLTVTVTVSKPLPYCERSPTTSPQEHPWLFDEWLADTPNPEDGEAWSRFVQEHPPPSACCLYFIEVWRGGFPRLVYIGSVFRQSARRRLGTHHVNAKLVAELQKSSGSRVTVRYGDIERFDFGPVRVLLEGKPEKSIVLPPDPEPLWTLPEDEQDKVIRDTEAALIYKLKPEFNTRNKSSYRGQPIRVILWDVPWVGSTKFSFTLNPEKR
jgi:hypothetical protein